MTRRPAATSKPKAAPRARPAEPRLPGAPTQPSAAATQAAPARGFYRPGDGQEPAPSPASDESPLAQFAGAPAAPLREPGPHVEQHGADVGLDIEHVDEDLTGDQGVVAAAEIDPDAQQETLEEAIARIQRTRKPLGSFSQKLAIPKRPGFHTHWFNDEGNRIAEALDAGWAHRLREGKPIKRAVGQGRDKGVLWAFAMDLPLVIWQQDMAVRHAFAEERMNALRGSPAVDGAGQAQRSDEGKFYSPRKDHLSVMEGQRR